MPAVPAATTIPAAETESIPRQKPVAAINVAATIPVVVPGRLIPPFEPGRTDLNVVSITVLPPSAIPTSLDVVSAAASARAARQRTRQLLVEMVAASAAIPRFAITCAADLPVADSAARSAFLRSRPTR